MYIIKLTFQLFNILSILSRVAIIIKNSYTREMIIDLIVKIQLFCYTRDIIKYLRFSTRA